MPIPNTDEELLAQCDVDTYGASGPGGQNVNRRATAVRLRHLPTGIVVTCQRERSQHRNKQLAVAELRRRLQNRFRPVRPRIPTRVSKGVRNRTLDKKKRHGLKKKLRQRPRMED